MYALVSRVPEPYYDLTIKLLQEIETEFGLTGIRVMPIPHFTLYLCTYIDIDEAVHVINKLIKQNPQIEVKTSGLEFFINELFVAYNAIENSAELKIFQNKIYDILEPLALHPASYYKPSDWVPHITLTLEGREKVSFKNKLMSFLRTKDLKWKFKMDNLLLIYQIAKTNMKIEHEFRFK